jgi:hypothetical protein
VLLGILCTVIEYALSIHIILRENVYFSALLQVDGLMEHGL